MKPMKVCGAVLLAMLPALASVSNYDKDKTAGDPAAPITIQVFSDFQCAGCKVFHENTLPLLMREYVVPGKVFVIFRDFPLNIHQYARVAANYAVAASRLGMYDTVANALFRDQDAWSVNGKVWESVASALKPKQQAKVRSMADDAAVFGAIQRDLDAGAAAAVNGTPMLVISRGVKHYSVPGGMSYYLLQKLLDEFAK
jgi:protein-disulfide isomerase